VSGGTVLIVDDNPMSVELSRFLLSRDGFDVRTAADAKESEFILKDFHPQLILMDIQLPGIDGLQLTRRLRNDPTNKDIVILALTAYCMKGDEQKALDAGCNGNILALTAYCMKGDEQKALDAGCNGYIIKPIDAGNFLDLVRSYLNPPPTEKPATITGMVVT